MHETTTHTPPRHLHAVADDGQVPTGVVWQSTDTTEPASGRVMDPDESHGALRPVQVDRAQITDRLKAALEAGNTYALLAWNRRWEVAMDYVMDSALRQAMLDAAEDDLDDKIADAEKSVRRARDENVVRAKNKLERLKRRRVSELEVDARVLRARTARLAGRCAVPAAVLVGPVLLAASGMWWGLLAWPAAWGWLALQGRAMARAESTTTATVTPVDNTAVTGAPAPVSGSQPSGHNPARVLGATTAETEVIQRLDPAYWAKNAKKRGLDGLEPDTPTLGVTGISVQMGLGGRWTTAALRARSDNLKAMLAVPEGAGVQVMPGQTGDVAVVRIRTRTTDTDVSWNPDRAGIGVVPETGRVVDLDAYGHRVVAGATGAGKSTAMRPWMASVVLNPKAALVFVDPKGQEAGLWEHCARTVKGAGPGGPDRMYQLIDEVVAELQWRQETAEGTDWVPTEEHPELVLVIDEGAALVRMSKEKAYRDILMKVEYLASQGRAGKVWLHWATQYPTKEGGIPAQVAENIVARLALHTATPQADRVVFDEQATATGWTPSELDLPGWGMLRTGPRDVPEHIQLWYMNDDHVQALPERTPWNRPEPDGDDDDGDEGGGSWIGAQGAVMDTLRQYGPRTLTQLDAELDFSKSMIDRALKELSGAGRVEKAGGYGAAWRAL